MHKKCNELSLLSVRMEIGKLKKLVPILNDKKTYLVLSSTEEWFENQKSTSSY